MIEERQCVCGTTYKVRSTNPRGTCYKCLPRCTRRTEFKLRENGKPMSLKERQAAESAQALEKSGVAILVHA